MEECRWRRRWQKQLGRCWRPLFVSIIFMFVFGGASVFRFKQFVNTDRTSISLRIAVWNLRVPFEQDESTWDDRRDSVASAIAGRHPHILATQEDCHFMNLDLENRLGSYERYGLFNRNGESTPSLSWPINAFSSVVGRDGEHNSVWYDSNQLTVQKEHTFWMSRSPSVPGTSFDEVTGRVVNCLLLRPKPSILVVDIFFCSTHLPSGNKTRQLMSVDVISEQFKLFHREFTTQGGEHLMLVSGDFNAVPGSATHTAMIEKGFVDARSISKEKRDISGYSPTTNDWHGAKDEMIDYLWIYNYKTGSNMSVNSVKHEQISIDNERTASDHKMVLVDLTLNGYA